MAVSLELKINDKEVLQLIDQLGEKARDLSRPMKLIGEQMLFSIEENFSVGGRPISWIPSARAIAQSGQTLVDKRRLESSINYRANRDSVRLGTNVVYGRAHQLGINRMVAVKGHTRLIKEAFGKKLKFPVYVNVERHAMHMNLPARPFLVVQEEDRAESLRIIKDYLLSLQP